MVFSNDKKDSVILFWYPIHEFLSKLRYYLSDIEKKKCKESFSYEVIKVKYNIERRCDEIRCFIEEKV